jgi:hypothetical protein
MSEKNDFVANSEPSASETVKSAPEKKVDRGRLGPMGMGVLQCDATRKIGGRCNNPAVRGSEKCRLHGGRALNSAVAPTFRTGRYSKMLPHKLRETYEAALADNELLSLRDELALMRARLSELAGRLETGESATLWTELTEVYEGMQDAVRNGDVERIISLLDSLGNLVQNGNGNEETWEMIKETLDGTVRINQAEWRRLVDMKQMITAEKAIALVMAVVAAVMRHVRDPHVQSAIHREVSQILNIDPNVTIPTSETLLIGSDPQDEQHAKKEPSKG